MHSNTSDLIAQWRAVLKGMIAEMEYALGVEGALPITMPLLAALAELDKRR